MIIDTDDVVKDTIYDPETGKLYRVKELVTTSEYDGGYRSRNLTFNGATKQATHIMYYLMIGEWPEKGMHIDHIDGDGSNHRWNNLRKVTPTQNLYNRNQSRDRWNGIGEDLVMGAAKCRENQYRVAFGGVSYGYFKTAKEANEVAVAKRQELHGEFARKPELPTPLFRRL